MAKIEETITTFCQENSKDYKKLEVTPVLTESEIPD